MVVKTFSVQFNLSNKILDKARKAVVEIVRIALSITFTVIVSFEIELFDTFIYKIPALPTIRKIVSIKSTSNFRLDGVLFCTNASGTLYNISF